MSETLAKQLTLWLMCITLSGALGFCWGVEHNAKEKWLSEKQEYAPMYTSRIVVKYGEAQVIAFTTPSCDSIRANDDGYWFNTTVNKPEAFITADCIEWPFNDDCTK